MKSLMLYPDVFELLIHNGYEYDSFFDSYYKGRECISADNVRTYPGAVRHYLETGYIREPRIFDTGLYGMKPTDMGFKMTKKGTLVKMRVVK